MDKGFDGLRVKPLIAAEITADGWDRFNEQLDAVRAAVANVDLTFSESAKRTGGSRRVRWNSQFNDSGCEVMLTAEWNHAPALASLESVLLAFERDGRIDYESPSKYLIWIDGGLLPEHPDVCAVSVSYADDVAGSFDNLNVLPTVAAMKEPCWDIVDGGSVPAQQLMHSLGAVQPSAPHSDGNGGCNDDYDLLCALPAATVTDGCTSLIFEALFDCNNDDYFNTNPSPDSTYLCTHWNTARSPFLEGWDNESDELAAPSMSVAERAGGIEISWKPGAGCPGPSAIGVNVSGVLTEVFPITTSSVFVPLNAGTYTVEVAALRDFESQSSVRTVQYPKPPPQMPVGGIVLSLTDGRGYGMLGWAIDPESGDPARMRVRIPGVLNREYDWNYVWPDMPAYTGINRMESLVFLAQLPPGEHVVCLDAQDPQTGEWTGIGCRTHSVK